MMKLKLSFAVLFIFVAFSSLSAYAAAGAVYTETNSSQNAILVFSRTLDGQLISTSARGASPEAQAREPAWVLKAPWPSTKATPSCLP